MQIPILCMTVHDTSPRTAWNYELTLKILYRKKGMCRTMDYILNIFEGNGSLFIQKKCSQAKSKKIDHSTSFDLDDLERATFIKGKFSFSPICAENDVFFVQFFMFCKNSR